jgi:hypothetical protein
VDASSAAWIGVGGSIVGGFVGALAAWLFGRNAARRDRLINVYGEWAVTCHEVLVLARGIGAVGDDEVRRNPGCSYEVAAAFYFGGERGESQRRAYEEAHRRLELSEFKVASAGDRDLRFVAAVVAITTEAQKIDVWKAAPDIRKAMSYLISFNTEAMPRRFGAGGWSKVGQVIAAVRDWLLEGVAREIADTQSLTQSNTARRSRRGSRVLDVLLLGAGASLGARADFPVRPPLGRELAGYLLRWLDANDPALPNVTRWPALAPTADPLIVGPQPWQNKRLLAEVRSELEKVTAEDQLSDAPHFEDLMNRWATAPTRRAGYRDHLEFTQRLLSYAMNFGHACAFLEQPDRFDDLLASFKPSVIVTVNYDLLVEQALKRLSRRHSHPGIPGPAAGDTFRELVSEGTGPIVPMFKLHGSVDWLAVKSGAAGTDEKAVEAAAAANPLTPRPNDGVFGDGVRLHSYDTKHTFESPNGASLRIDLQNDYQPVVAIYGRGKPMLRNLAHVRAHREACFKLLTDATVGRVLAVGVRPVTEADDQIVHRLIRHLGAVAAQKIYVSPSAGDCRAFEALGFSARRVGLADYLDLDRWG